MPGYIFPAYVPPRGRSPPGAGAQHRSGRGYVRNPFESGPPCPSPMGTARAAHRDRSLLRTTALTASVGFVLLVALAGAVHAAGDRASPAAHAAAGTDQLTVTVGTAYAFTLSTDEVTPGDNVSVTIVQTDDVQHTFTLSSVAGYTFPSSDTSSDLLAYFQSHAPLVNVTIPAGAATLHASFTAPAFGEYEYVCLVPGHFQLGMFGFLGSGEHGTSGSASTGPGAPVFIIGGTIAGLVVIAIVLGFVIGRRKGAVHEMPPERLGYPGEAGQPTSLPPKQP